MIWSSGCRRMVTLVVRVEIELIDEEDVETLLSLIELVVNEVLATRIIDMEEER